ncbi:hypothetical protein D3C77_99770 [compost metagenome]
MRTIEAATAVAQGTGDQADRPFGADITLAVVQAGATQEQAAIADQLAIAIVERITDVKGQTAGTA